MLNKYIIHELSEINDRVALLLRALCLGSTTSSMYLTNGSRSLPCSEMALLAASKDEARFLPRSQDTVSESTHSSAPTVGTSSNALLGNLAPAFHVHFSRSNGALLSKMLDRHQCR